jgi:hypothetical protein
MGLGLFRLGKNTGFGLITMEYYFQGNAHLG